MAGRLALIEGIGARYGEEERGLLCKPPYFVRRRLLTETLGNLFEAGITGHNRHIRHYPRHYAIPTAT